MSHGGKYVDYSAAKIVSATDLEYHEAHSSNNVYFISLQSSLTLWSIVLYAHTFSSNLFTDKWSCSFAPKRTPEGFGG